jgi:hypothetical protein
VHACVLASILAVACVALTGAAYASTAYYGDWSVLIATNRRACGPSYRFGVQISDGAVIYENGMVSMRGRVAAKGAVRVAVQSGSQSANGFGRLTKSRGGGVWRGQGTSGTCSGNWMAEPANREGASDDTCISRNRRNEYR